MEQIGQKFINRLSKSGGWYELAHETDKQVLWECQPLSDPQETVPEMEEGWMWITAAGLRLL